MAKDIQGGDRMRIHADSYEGHKANAYLNGKDVSAMCVQADDEEGWVELLVKDAAGNYVLAANDEDILTEKHYGEVVIEL